MHPGWRAARSRGFWDLPGALIELLTVKILEGLQRIQEGELPSPWASEIRQVL